MTVAASMFISRDFVHVESRTTAQETVWAVSDQWVRIMRSSPKPELVWLLETGCRRIAMAVCPEVESTCKRVFYILFFYAVMQGELRVDPPSTL